MIDDIIFDTIEFILETTLGTPGGVLSAISLDGGNYDIKQPETSRVFIS